MKHIKSAALAIALLMPVTAMAQDWGGFYGGLQIGRGDFGLDGTATTTDNTYGVFGGYNQDFGSYVLGLELEAEGTNITTTGGTDLDSQYGAKARAGYKVGSGLVFATLGYAVVDTSNLGTGRGATYGIGYDHAITDRMFIGAEYQRHDIGNLSGAIPDAELDQVSVRAGFRF